MLYWVLSFEVGAGNHRGVGEEENI